MWSYSPFLLILTKLVFHMSNSIMLIILKILSVLWKKMTFPWNQMIFPDLYLTFPWLFQEFSKIFPWLFPDLSKIFPWLFPDFSKIWRNSLTFPGFPWLLPKVTNFPGFPGPVRTLLKLGLGQVGTWENLDKKIRTARLSQQVLVLMKLGC